MRTVYVPFGSWFKGGRDSEDDWTSERLACRYVSRQDRTSVTAGTVYIPFRIPL